MKRTPLAAAVAALFLMTSSAAYAQTGTTATPTPAGTAGSSAMAGKAGANATGTGSTAAGAAVPGTAPSTTTTTKGNIKSTLSHGDRKFLEEAATGGMKEVEMGRVVADKASDPAVKAFAERMVKDHGDANKKLADLAQSKGVVPPAELKRGDRRDVDKMAKMSAAKIDRAYMDDMVKDHKKDVKEFEKQAKDAKDPEVKKFAADTLPTLQDHLKQAQDTQSKLKGGGSAATRTSTTGAGTSAAGSPAPAPGATTTAGMSAPATAAPKK